MLIDERDSLRNQYELGKKKAEACIIRNHGQLCVPMPALGEALHIQRTKNRSNASIAYEELNRLIDDDFLRIKFIKSSDTFRIASEIMNRSRGQRGDDRNRISPMDALILASATTDTDSSTFYTTDDQMLSVTKVDDIIQDYREEKGCAPLNLIMVDHLLRN